MNILIIEDEELAYKNLVRLIHQYDDAIKVLAWTTTVRSSVDWLLKNTSPDLIFADIHLPDATAFEIFKNTGSNIPVIFTTAYDHYAIEAFEVNSVDYLLKPIRFDRLSKSLDKYKQTRGNALSQAMILHLHQQIMRLSLAGNEYKQRFLTRKGDKFNYIETSEISFFYAEGNIVFAVTRENKKACIDNSLEDIAKKLNPKEFFRVSRKYLLHITSIRSVSRYFHSRLKIITQPEAPDDIIISRIRVPAFLNWMEGMIT